MSAMLSQTPSAVTRRYDAGDEDPKTVHKEGAD